MLLAGFQFMHRRCDCWCDFHALIANITLCDQCDKATLMLCHLGIWFQLSTTFAVREVPSKHRMQALSTDASPFHVFQQILSILLFSFFSIPSFLHHFIVGILHVCVYSRVLISRIPPTDLLSRQWAVVLSTRNTIFQQFYLAPKDVPEKTKALSSYSPSRCCSAAAESFTSSNIDLDDS